MFLAGLCTVINGVTDPNSVTVQNRTTNTYTCGCKPGYTNTGNGTTVTCTGNLNINRLILIQSCASYSFPIMQTVVKSTMAIVIRMLTVHTIQ